jgi:hypothetical protein
MNMTARDIEVELLGRCIAVARTSTTKALDQREANIFYVAAIVIKSKFPNESLSLIQASELYFAVHPNERMAAADVIRNGWISSLPRLRDCLSIELNR